MHSVKEKISNMASVVKKKIIICQAKADEKAEKAIARTKEEKEIAHERRKAKEAKAKMELHQAKAEHAAEKLRARQSHLMGHHVHGQQAQPVVGGTHGYTQPPVVGTDVTAASTAPSVYPPPMGVHL